MTVRLDQALAFALAAHGPQTRKGTGVPYVSHLLQVSGMVLEHGGDTIQACAGLLHDVVEDTAVTLVEVVQHFGPEVAEIVADCSDTLADESPTHKRPWQQRKQAYVVRLQAVPARSALVIGCDKVHNLRSTVADLQTHGPEILARFNAPPPAQKWLQAEIRAALASKLPVALERELAALSARYAELVGVDGSR